MRVLVFSAIAIGAAFAVPAIYQKNPGLFATVLHAPSASDAGNREDMKAPDMRSATGTLSGRKVTIDAGRGGHFMADFRLNGRTLPAIVDTGATLVAINASTARRLGVKLSPGDFRYSVQTANGMAKAAAAKLASVEIGRVHLDDVDAAVLEDKALSGTLIGMSFLKRLRHYSVEDGALVLEQ